MMITPDQVDIKDFLPHRPPMLLVDELVTIDQDSASCSFQIPSELLFLRNGRLTGSGLIEHAAQSSTAVVGQRFFPDGKVKADGSRVLGFISAIKNVIIGELPQPGTTLITRSTLVSHVPNGPVSICVMDVETKALDVVVLNCSMNFLIEHRKR